MRFGHFHDGTERNHFALVVARFESRDVLGVRAELRVRLRDDFVGAAKTVEIIDVKRAEINLHRLEKIVERDAFGLRLLAVNIRVELRHVDGEARKCPVESGRRVTFADDVLQILVERVVAKIGAVFDIQFETADRAKSHDRWRRHGEDERILNDAQFLVQRGGDGRAAQIFRRSFFKWFQREENNARVRCDAEAADAQTGKRDRRIHAGQFHADVRHTADDGFRAVERRAVGQLRECDEILFVLSWHETGRHFVEAPAGEQNESAVKDERDDAFAQHARDAAGIFISRPREHAVERMEKPAQPFVHDARDQIFRRVMIFQQHRAQCGRKRERIERGNNRGNRNRQRELFVKLSGQAADECRRHKHRAQHERRRDDRASHFIHRLSRRRHR